MMRLPLILGTALTLFVIASCASVSEESYQNAKKQVQEETTQEKQLFYDNGQNFFIVRGGEVSKAVAIMQKWVTEHPDKKIVSHSYIRFNGYFWVVYYEDR